MTEESLPEPTPVRCPHCDDADMVEMRDERRGVPILFCGRCHWEEDPIDWLETDQ